jgi:hypothetical protein
MKKLTRFIVLLIIVSAFSCQSKQNEKSGMIANMMTPSDKNESTDALEKSPAPPPPPESDYALAEITVSDDIVQVDESQGKSVIEKPVNKKKIIKDGSMTIRSKNINSGKKAIDDICKKFNAYYDSEELQNNDKSINYNLKLRIPSENFESLILAIENGKDEIISKNIEARDVTEEYIDIVTRLNNKQAYLKRYRDLLAKAVSVKDILAIEENISALQEEIESKEGRLKYLKDQVAYSTLSISLYKEKEYVYQPSQHFKFSERVKNSLANGWTSVVDFVLWIIKVWPGIIIIVVLIFFIRRFITKRKRKLLK